jgi:hypothetical protein
VLVIILLSYLMIVLDISIVITALPKMHTALGPVACPRALDGATDETTS